MLEFKIQVYSAAVKGVNIEFTEVRLYFFQAITNVYVNLTLVLLKKKKSWQKNLDFKFIFIGKLK